jgi:hypothetical protein
MANLIETPQLAEVEKPQIKKGRPFKIDKMTSNMSEYKKNHYIGHKDYILNFHSQTIKCPKCDKTMKYSSKSKHLRNTCINRNQIN